MNTINKYLGVIQGIFFFVAVVLVIFAVPFIMDGVWNSLSIAAAIATAAFLASLYVGARWGDE